MNQDIQIASLTKDRLGEAISLVLRAKLDAREEIEYHLHHLDEHRIAVINGDVVGVIGWYQDNVHYADTAMGSKFPGEKAYWVGFFAVDETYRNKGIGSLLLQELENVLKNKNIKDLWVSSVPETRTYYEQHGFRLAIKGVIGGNQKFFMVKEFV